MNAYLQSKITLRQKKQRFNKFILGASFRISLIIFIIVFSLLYIWQTNSVSTKGYIISDLEKNTQQLEYENRRLEVDIAKNTSMQSIQERIKNINLVVVDRIEYLTAVGSSVAQR